MGPLLKTTAITAGVVAAAAIPLNVAASVNDPTSWGALGAVAGDTMVGIGAAAVAAVGGAMALIGPTKEAAPYVAGFGLGTFVGTAAGLGALVVAERIKIGHLTKPQQNEQIDPFEPAAVSSRVQASLANVALP